MIGVSAGRLRAYLRAGVLSPEKGTRGELRFSFQDLLLLRKAEGLVSQRISPHRVRRALKELRERLTDEQPLTGVPGDRRPAGGRPRTGRALAGRVGPGAAGVRADSDPDGDARRRWSTLPTRPAACAAGRRRRAPDGRGDLRARLRSRRGRSRAGGVELPPGDREAPHHADAHINLGRILHERGDYRRRGALPARARDPPERSRPPASTSASCSRTAAHTPRRSRPTSARSPPTSATRTPTTTPPASTICWATTRRRCATCASAATSPAGSVAAELGRLPGPRLERYLAANAGEPLRAFVPVDPGRRRRPRRA